MPAPFLFGLEGTKASKASVRLLRDTDAAGILLLARNITSPAQVRALVSGLQDALGRPLIVSIDHEGGWVMRFTAGVTFFPGNAALGKCGDPALAKRTGAVMGRELRAMGVNYNLGPVLDVLGPDYNPGIGIRSFGSDPALVGRLGSALICGQEGHGVAACAKHFPGKGAATVDAHVDLPLIKLTKAELERHLAPFRAAIRGGVASIMTSHVLMPAIDPRQPATFSRRAVHGLLRRRLGFDGVIISDDLCMGAVTKRMAVGEACVKALAAGHDLLIVAHGEPMMRESAEAVGLALDGGLLPDAERSAMERRLAAFTKEWGGPARGPSPRPDVALARRVADAAVEVLRRGAVPLPVPRGRNVLAVWPDLREVRERFAFEGGPEGPLGLAKKRLPGARFIKAPVASERLPDGFEKTVRAADLVLFFCYEARRFPGQKAALDALRLAAPAKTVALLLRSPRDLDLLAAETTAVTAQGYRDCQLEALLDRLR